jgi:hypothetical protein
MIQEEKQIKIREISDKKIRKRGKRKAHFNEKEEIIIYIGSWLLEASLSG